MGASLKGGTLGHGVRTEGGARTPVGVKRCLPKSHQGSNRAATKDKMDKHDRSCRHQPSGALQVCAATKRVAVPYRNEVS
eukprot:COSAG01_NODE_8061_length_2935_cov_31.857284_4_plen_80_part_00